MMLYESKTQEFKSKISDACKALEDSIAELYTEADTTEDIDRKEEIYLEIDGLKDDSICKDARSFRRHSS